MNHAIAYKKEQGSQGWEILPDHHMSETQQNIIKVNNSLGTQSMTRNWATVANFKDRMLQQVDDTDQDGLDDLTVDEGIGQSSTPILDNGNSGKLVETAVGEEGEDLVIVDVSGAQDIKNAKEYSEERAEKSIDEAGDDGSYQLIIIIAIVSFVIIIIICFALLLKNLSNSNGGGGGSSKKSKQEKDMKEQQGQIVQVFTQQQIQKMHEIRKELEMRARISQGQNIRQIEHQIMDF